MNPIESNPGVPWRKLSEKQRRIQMYGSTRSQEPVQIEPLPETVEDKPQAEPDSNSTEQ